jgi:flagellar operon protein
MGRYDVLLPRAGPRSLVEPAADRKQPVERARGPTFDEILKGEVGGRVTLSAHAKERLQSRNIELTPVDLDRIDRALGKLAEKGGRESLLMTEKAAFVVSVPNRTVITAMAPNEVSDHVFTKIDSAMVLR